MGFILHSSKPFSLAGLITPFHPVEYSTTTMKSAFDGEESFADTYHTITEELIISNNMVTCSLLYFGFSDSDNHYPT